MDIACQCENTDVPFCPFFLSRLIAQTLCATQLPLRRLVTFLNALKIDNNLHIDV